MTVATSQAPDEQSAEVYQQRWEAMWAAGLEPGQAFDNKESSPALVQLLHTGQLDVKGKRVFVPGCGRGYDVIEFAKAGAAAAVGLELSPTAVKAAAAYRDSCRLDTNVSSRTDFQQGDFFRWSAAGGQFDVGYDYTFLCALTKDLRPSWAEGWARQIKSGGELVTLMFPVDPTKTDGPPFAVDPELYRELLTAHGFAEESVTKVPDSLSHDVRRGKEYLGRWRRV